MYPKGTHATSSSGAMSLSSFHSGLSSVRAHRSQTALTSAAVARWMTPFSGPSHRSWLSPVRWCQKPPISDVMVARSPPSSRGARLSMAATHSSLPRPIVNVNPWPARPSSVSTTT